MLFILVIFSFVGVEWYLKGRMQPAIATRFFEGNPLWKNGWRVVIRHTNDKIIRIGNEIKKNLKKINFNKTKFITF